MYLKYILHIIHIVSSTDLLSQQKVGFKFKNHPAVLIAILFETAVSGDKLRTMAMISSAFCLSLDSSKYWLH